MKGILRLEIEKLQCGQVDEKSFENRSTNGDLGGHPNMSDGRQNADFDVHSSYGAVLDRNGSVSHGLGDSDTNDVSISVLVGFSCHIIYRLELYGRIPVKPFTCSHYYFVLLQFQAFDFRITSRNEPFLQLFHCLYVYPLSVSMTRKRNLFIRVELRKDDADIRKPPLEV